MQIVESGVFSLSGFQLQQGQVREIYENGIFQVNCISGLGLIFCEFLRTSSYPPPNINLGDTVLCLVGDSESRGYILGVTAHTVRDARQVQQGIVAKGLGHVSEVHITAETKIELRCGRSSLSMSKDGKIVLKGEELVSRARRVNKIKGAAVKIN